MLKSGFLLIINFSINKQNAKIVKVGIESQNISLWIDFFFKLSEN